MAHRIKVLSLRRPRIEQGNTVQKAELIRLASRATGLVESTLEYSIKELRDQIIEITRTGRAVKIEGLGTWTPNIGLDSSFDIQYRADTALIKRLNVPGTFSGTIRNPRNIGKTGMRSSTSGMRIIPRIRLRCEEYFQQKNGAAPRRLISIRAGCHPARPGNQATGITRVVTYVLLIIA